MISSLTHAIHEIHSQEQIGQIATSISEFGFVNPVLIGEDHVIIAGHGRVMAAQQLGLETVPVITLSHLSQTQRRALVIADNKLTENASWDNALLSAELCELKADDFDIDSLGFDKVDLDALLSDLEDEPTNDPKEAQETIPEISQNPVSKQGDIWVLGNHRLLCGDATCSQAFKALLGSARWQTWSLPTRRIMSTTGMRATPLGVIAESARY